MQGIITLEEFNYIKINLPIWVFLLIILIFFVTLLTTYFSINKTYLIK